MQFYVLRIPWFHVHFVRILEVSHQFLVSNSFLTAQKADYPLGGDTMTTKNTKT